MARQGRTCAVELLAWKKHRVCTDTRGNMFFLVFISKLRPTRVEDMMRKFVSRDPLAMQDADVQAWVSLCFATSVAEAEHALEQLRVYDPRACSFNWTRAVRMFSDLRLVVLGPNTQRMWTLRNVTDPSEDGNVHHLGLCFLCAHAVLHGPCEHLYLALLALGRFQFTYAPSKSVGQGRPRLVAQPRVAFRAWERPRPTRHKRTRLKGQTRPMLTERLIQCRTPFWTRSYGKPACCTIAICSLPSRSPCP